jgi:hypothetical protein
MDDLELELVVVAEVFKFGLAGEEIFGVEVELVVECAVAGHLVVEEFAVHGAPCGVSDILSGLEGKVERTFTTDFAEGTEKDRFDHPPPFFA